MLYPPHKSPINRDITYKTDCPLVIKKEAKKPIVHGRREKAYNKVEERQDELQLELIRIRNNLNHKITILYRLKNWAYRDLSCTASNLIGKSMTRRLIIRLGFIFQKIKPTWNEINRSFELLNRSHVELYKMEDFNKNFEENLTLFFKASRLMKRDLIRLNAILAQLDFMNELNDSINWNLIESNTPVLYHDTFLALSRIQKTVHSFELMEIDKPIVVPGETSLPLEFHPELLVFDLRQK